jgi:FAD:protein FMN transferase
MSALFVLVLLASSARGTPSVDAVGPAAAPATAQVRAQYLMGTVCEISAASPSQIDAAFAEAKRVEAMLSTWIEDSELIRVNRGAAPGPELGALLDNARAWSVKTNRAFDPRWRGDRYEAGAFGKGYALDRMLALTTGDAVIDFGGQLAVRGSHEVSIADPVRRDQPLLSLNLTDASLSTSGDSERPGHVVDPRTGRPVRSRGSVSVIAADALTADILSTALYVMGADEGLRWADANGIAAIFITDSRLVRRSSHAPRDLVLLDANYKLKD